MLSANLVISMALDNRSAETLPSNASLPSKLANSTDYGAEKKQDRQK